MQNIENLAEIYPRTVEINQRDAMFEDRATWLAEVLNGQMHTEFDFAYKGGELIGKDGRRLGEIFDKAIEDTEEKIKTEPEMAFELRRNKKERGEFDDMIDMIDGKKPNTMVVISDFPAELMNAPKDIGGYNTRRRQTMMRVITKNEDDTLTIQSQSLDGSYRFALESIYDHLGQKPEPGELLGQRIHLDLPPVWQKQLNENLKNKYDETLKQQFGGEWEAGRRPVEYDNTYDFVLLNRGLIDTYIDNNADSPDDSEARYNLAAAMEARYQQFKNVKDLITPQVGQAILRHFENMTPAQRNWEMRIAGAQASASGETYSGCGLTLKRSTTEQQLQELGYGEPNKKDEPESTPEEYDFNIYTYCVVCQDPPKEGEKKKWCGPCGICKGCDPTV